MNFLIFMSFLLQLCNEIKGQERESKTDDFRRSKLIDIGCNEKGQLLDESVCVNSSYLRSQPPTSSTSVYMAFRFPLRIGALQETKTKRRSY